MLIYLLNIMRDVILIVVGACLGLLSTLLVENYKEGKETQNRKRQMKELLLSLLSEIEIGIERTEGLVKMTEDQKNFIFQDIC